MDVWAAWSGRLDVNVIRAAWSGEQNVIHVTVLSYECIKIGLKFTSCKLYPCKHFIFSHRIPRKANLRGQTTNYVQHSPPQKVTQLPSYHPFWPETSSLLLAFFPLPAKYLRNRVSSVSWWRRLGLIRIRRSRPWAFRRVWAVTLPLLAPFCRP